MKLFDIFKRKPKKVRFRDQESVFFTMTDENGISYVNMSDSIQYIPVGTTLNIGRGGYIFNAAVEAMQTYDDREASLLPSVIVSYDVFSPAYTNRFKELMNFHAKNKERFPGYKFERSSNE